MKKRRSIARAILTIFIFGSILFVLGAANLWEGAGFTMALGLVLILFAHAVITIWGSRSWESETARQASIERTKRDRQVAEALKVGDRIELHSFDILPPHLSQWEAVEVTAILPRAPDGHVMVQVRHSDGTESAQSLIRLWRKPSPDTWRPLTS